MRTGRPMQISMSFAAFLAAILFISAPLAQAQTAEDQAALAAVREGVKKEKE